MSQTMLCKYDERFLQFNIDFVKKLKNVMKVSLNLASMIAVVQNLEVC